MGQIETGIHTNDWRPNTLAPTLLHEAIATGPLNINDWFQLHTYLVGQDEKAYRNFDDVHAWLFNSAISPFDVNSIDIPPPPELNDNSAYLTRTLAVNTIFDDIIQCHQDNKKSTNIMQRYRKLAKKILTREEQRFINRARHYPEIAIDIRDEYFEQIGIKTSWQEQQEFLDKISS